MMDPVQAQAAFDQLADAHLALVEARAQAKKAKLSYLHRVAEHVAEEFVGLEAIDYAIEHQRKTLRSFVNAALHFEAITIPEILALEAMLPRMNAIFGPLDRETARVAVAIGGALRQCAEMQAEAMEPDSLT